MADYSHSIRIESARCAGRMVCLKSCPTEAIRVRHGKAQMLEDRCIDCGECARVCPEKAIVPCTSSFTDFSRFKYTVALPSPVLYGQFRKDILPHMILAGLKRIGFDDACDVACATEAVSIAVEQYLATYRGPFPALSPFCPAIVRLIQVRHPTLIDSLVPIEAPMEIAARETRHKKVTELGLREEEIGVIYLTPCPCKIVAIEAPPRKRASHLDGAIAISEIYHPLLSAMAGMGAAQNGEESVTGIGLGWPVLGGQVASLKAESALAVGGLAEVERILEEIERGELSDVQYVECHACPQGCCSGSLTVDNPYVARAKVLQLVDKFAGIPSQDSGTMKELYQQGYFSLPGTIAPTPFAPLDKEIARAIQKRARIQDLYETLPRIDCAACGSPTCFSFAEDVVLERAQFDDCVVLRAAQPQARAAEPAGLAADPAPAVAGKKHKEDSTP
jgi:iron only hydrogenase large subunit-like protein